MALLQVWMLHRVLHDLGVCRRVWVLSDDAKVTLLLQVIDGSAVIEGECRAGDIVRLRIESAENFAKRNSGKNINNVFAKLKNLGAGRAE